MEHKENGKNEIKDYVYSSELLSPISDVPVSERNPFEQVLEEQRPHSAPSSSTYESLMSNDVKKIPVLTPTQRNTVYRQRHMKFLFESLKGTLEEVIETCEEDFKIEECFEVIQMLKSYIKEFKKLVKKIETISEYENATSTGTKPRSIAWEERKASPKRQQSPPSSPVGIISTLHPNHFGNSTPSADSSLSFPFDHPTVSVAISIPDSDVSLAEHIPSSPLQRVPSTGSLSVNSNNSPGKSHLSPNKSHILHNRLSSPERNKKKSPEEAKEENKKKQEVAQKRREQLEAEKKIRAKINESKIHAINEKLSEKQEKRRKKISQKFEKADQIHGAYIHTIKNKAATENIKVEEIQFITQLRKKLEDSEQRKNELLEDKKRKLGTLSQNQKQVIERKKKILETKEKNKGTPKKQTSSSAHSIPTTPVTVTNPSVDLLSRSDSLSADNKYNESSLVSKNPRRITQVCKYCNVEIPSEEYIATHMSGKKHKVALDKAGVTPEEALHCVITLPNDPEREDEERTQSMKQKAKKARKKMARVAVEYEETHPTKESPHKARILKMILGINQQLTKNYVEVEKTLVAMARVLIPKSAHVEIDQHIIRQTGGIDSVIKLCTSEATLPSSLITAAITVLSLTCQSQPANIVYIIMTNHLSLLINLLERTVDKKESFHNSLLTLITLHLWQPLDSFNEKGHQMKSETIEYLIDMCIIDKLKQRLFGDPLLGISTDASELEFIEKSCELLEAITAFGMNPNSQRRPVYAVDDKPSETTSSIISAFKDTHFVGIVSLLVSLLLQQGPPRNDNSHEIPHTLVHIAHVCVNIMNNIASLNLVFFQEFLGSDDYQVEVYHILGYLLGYCTSDTDHSVPNSSAIAERKTKLLHELILLIGYYSIQNRRNQELLQWGKSPTILQRLCSLHFQYYSDPRYKAVLFPTLIASSFMNDRNKTILEQEMSSALLVAFVKLEAEAIAISAEPLTQKESPAKVPLRFQFSQRFPPSLWESAALFFSSKTSSIT